MKANKIFANIFILCFIFITFTNCFSQSGNMDTSHVLLSSPEFDYKNPQFDKTGGSVNYSIKDCILAYEKWSSPANSVISVRFIKYNSLGTETDLSDNSSLNINPAVAYNTDFFLVENGPGAVAFQSNRNGNWDIYISFYNSVTWNPPSAVGITTEDETEPAIVPYMYNNSLNYLLTFKRGNDIYVKNFFNGAWKDDVNLTDSDSLDCFSPELTKTVFSDNQFFIAYNRKISPDVSSIAYQRFFINTDGTLNNVLTKNISQQNTQTNIRFSNGVNYLILNYDYDTLGRKNFYSASLKINEYYIWNQTIGYTGNNFGGTGSSHGDITSDYPSGYSLYSWIRKIQDSTQIVITGFYSDYFTRMFYVGDSNTETFVNTSTKLVFGPPFTSYRIRILWEKEINGRTALIESFRDANLTSENPNALSVAGEFSLSQNYPNPFNPVTVIRYSLVENRFVTLKVYDVRGNEIATLVNEKQNSGTYNYQFSTVNYQLSSGVYFYKLEAGDFTETKRMILIK